MIYIFSFLPFDVKVIIINNHRVRHGVTNDDKGLSHATDFGAVWTICRLLVE